MPLSSCCILGKAAAARLACRRKREVLVLDVEYVGLDVECYTSHEILYREVTASVSCRIVACFQLLLNEFLFLRPTS